MASYEGDVIRAPGFEQVTAAAEPEILYSYTGLLQKGGTLKPGTGVYPAGTALKFDAATKRYEKATAAADTVGFVRISVDSGAVTDIPKQAVIVFGGVLKAQYITGVTANAALATALGGSFNTERQFLKF